jgi:hypothetical protein
MSRKLSGKRTVFGRISEKAVQSIAPKGQTDFPQNSQVNTEALIYFSVSFCIYYKLKG